MYKSTKFGFRKHNFTGEQNEKNAGMWTGSIWIRADDVYLVGEIYML